MSTPKTRTVRITERSYVYLSGFTNLKPSNNLELILVMMENHPDSLAFFMSYMKAKDEAVQCAVDGLEMFEDYIFIRKDKVTEMKRKLSTKEYQAKKKKVDNDEMPDDHARFHQEMQFEFEWTELGRSENDELMKPWVDCCIDYGMDEANRKLEAKELSV